jgi:hypothetical protein
MLLRMVPLRYSFTFKLLLLQLDKNNHFKKGHEKELLLNNVFVHLAFMFLQKGIKQ